MFLSPILIVIGVNLLQFLSIQFMKTTTEESFSLKVTKPPSLQVPRNRANHVDNSQSEMTWKKLDRMQVY